MKRLIVGTSAAAAILWAVPGAGAGAATATTTITMTVTGCEGCVITPSRTPADVDQAYNGPKATVTNGVATFVVPTEQTLSLIHISQGIVR